jgi:trimethylamine--corrinoid protein Co-methyltransferase
MRIWGSANVLTEEEITLIERTALRILEEIGVLIPNETMLARFAEVGARVDRLRRRVRFPAALVRDFVASAEPVSWDEPHITAYSGAYSRNYIPSGEAKARPSTLASIVESLVLADHLNTVDGSGCPGVPTEVPAILAPLFMRLLCWRFTERKPANCGEVWDTRLCPFVKEMGEAASALEGGEPGRWAQIAVEMIPPLRFGVEEAVQYVYFWENGLPRGVGNMLSAGGSAPATLAGALALQLAETFFLNLLQWAFAGGPEVTPGILHGTHSSVSSAPAEKGAPEAPLPVGAGARQADAGAGEGTAAPHPLRGHSLSFGPSVSVLDMKHGMYPYGRPEIALTHLAMGQLARHYRADFGSNSFSGDAKVPGCEAGMQKAFSTIAGIVAGTRTLGAMGLLSVDEIFSLDQLVIDGEFASALKRLARGFTVNEETLAYDVIQAVGPGGIFTDQMHTVTHYRDEHWQPQLFSREMLGTWLREGAKTDLDKAREVCAEARETHHPKGIKDETVAELLKVIAAAAKHFSVRMPKWPF